MGCSHHNGLEKWGDNYLSVWYTSTFGQEAWRLLWQDARDHVGKKPAEWELQEWIKRYRFLLDDRPSTYTFDMLIELGYFGKWPQKG